MKLTMLVVTATSLWMVGCKDKAEPAFKACVEAEAKGDVFAAQSDCERAVGEDGASTSGKAAAAKLEAMKPALRKARKEREEAAAVAAKVAEEARVQRLAQLRTKIRKRYSGEEPDGECTGKGLPVFRWYYEGGTYPENQEVATADRCVKLHQTEEIQVYCCPQKPFTGLF